MKAMKLLITLSTLILLFFQNCIFGQNIDKAPIPSLNLLECANRRALKLSDIVSESRLVKLETNDTCLIGRDSKYLVGSKYIICITQSTILQFDSDGGFIRKIAQYGRGPGEFINISGVDIDREEKNLFFTSNNSKMIQVVDLLTGEFNAQIPVALGGTSSKIIVLNDRLAIIPSITGNEKYLLYYQDLLGKFIEGIPVTYKKIPQMILRSSNDPLSHGDNIYYSESKVCGDTIFVINGLNKTPTITVYGGNQFGLSVTDPTGYYTMLLAKSIDFWLFTNQLFEMSNNALNIGDVHYYLVDENASRLSEITELILDNFGKTYSYDELKKGFLTSSSSFDLAREQFILRIEAIEYKKIVANNKMNVSENELKQIRKFDKEVSIYDNPILLIGKLK